MNPMGNVRLLKPGEEVQEGEIELTMTEAKKQIGQTRKKRKNWMRNTPCKCGSGKKYKKCCWSKNNIALMELRNLEKQQVKK